MSNDTFDLELQRLVDGELSRARIHSMLRSAENSPGIWREMALAFVEQQVVGREIAQMVSDVSECDEPQMASDTVARDDWDDEVADEACRPAPHSRPWMASLPRIAPWMAAAASVLLMLPLGFWMGRGGPNGWQAIPVNLGPASIQSADMSQRQLADGASDGAGGVEWAQRKIAPYSMRLVSDDGQPLADADIPLIPHTIAQEMGIKLPTIEIPQATQDEYRQAGFQLQPRVRFLAGRLRDGREVIVPVQDLTLVAYGQ